MSEALKKWEEATQELVDEFIQTYYDHDAWSAWVADDIGGVLCVNDDYYDLERIIDALRYMATEKQLFDYYDLEIEAFEDGDRKIANFKNFVKYGKTWL